MFLNRLVGFWKGNIEVKITCANCEQVLGAVHRAGISLWRVRRVDEQSLAMQIHAEDLERFRSVAARYFAEINILHATGVFRYRHLSKRVGIYFGIVLGLGLLALINCFVWNIEVIGCDEKTTESEVLRQFDELGFTTGKWRFGLDLTTLENNFLRQNPEVMWVSVNMHFTTARIELRERVGKQAQIYDQTTPCDIVAARDGKIIELMLTNGRALVSEGDAVHAGQMLVSREYITRYNETIIVHSMARVLAETEREISVEMPMDENVHTPTGKSKNFYTLTCFNFKIPLYFKEKISYNRFDISYHTYQPRIGDFALPIVLTRKRYTEITEQRGVLDAADVRLQAKAALNEKEKALLVGAEIKQKSVTESQRNNKLILTAHYKCIEDIAITIGE